MGKRERSSKCGVRGSGRGYGMWGLGLETSGFVRVERLTLGLVGR